MRLCVAKQWPVTLTETFIRAHVERLPAETTLLHNWPPQIERSAGEQIPVLGQSLWHKGWRVLQRRADESLFTSGYIKALRKVRAEVVLAEYGPTGVVMAEACRKLNLPLVVHFHGYDASKQEILERHRDDYLILFRQAAAVVAVSREMEATLIEMGAPPHKVHWNPCGVDLGDFQPARPAEAGPVFLFVGRFVAKKAPHLTVLAFDAVRRRYPDAHLRMVGDGPLLGVCRDLVEALHLRNSVTFLGAQPHEVVREEMQHARAYVQHSVRAVSGDSEGTPVAVMEAGVAGLPVISTRHAGIPDIVWEGETGLLVNERDVDGMAEAMLLLARDPARAQELGEAARVRISDHFSMERSIEGLWSIIQNAAVGVSSDP